MIRNPIDPAVRVSPQLSALIESRVNDPDVDQPITLAQVRAFMADLLPAPFKEAERLHHFDVAESIPDELNALIEEYGKDALAIDFIRVSARRTAFTGDRSRDERREPGISAHASSRAGGHDFRLADSTGRRGCIGG